MNPILQYYEIVKTDIQSARGCYLYDSQGKRYIDFEAGVWCTGLGHNHPRVNQAIRNQLEQVTHLGYRFTNAVVEETAQTLLATAGFEGGKCTFLSSGSEAVEFAVQSARRIDTRPLLLTLSDSFLAAYGSAGKKNPLEWHGLDWSACALCPQSEECTLNCPVLAQIPFELIGGFVFEPGNTSGLVRLPPAGLIQTLCAQIHAQGGLVIVDEVTTGMGRTGAWWGFEHYPIQPDIMATSKGLGNGYPVSAVLFNPQTAARLETVGYRYAQSHQNDPLGCAVAREVMAVMHEDRLVERSQKVGESFLTDLRLLMDRHASIKEVRGRGLMIALELRAENEPQAARTAFEQLLQQGLIVGLNPAANLLRFYPPLTIEKDDVQLLINGLDSVLP